VPEEGRGSGGRTYLRGGCSFGRRPGHGRRSGGSTLEEGDDLAAAEHGGEVIEALGALEYRGER
jgi:hypothetical protein